MFADIAHFTNACIIIINGY